MWFCVTANAVRVIFNLSCTRVRLYGSRVNSTSIRGKLNNSRGRSYTKPHTEIRQTLSFPNPTQKKESGLDYMQYSYWAIMSQDLLFVSKA